MDDLSYRTLVWLTYRLAATFALGLPLILLVWASAQKESSMVRLLTIYWKISSLMAISILLLTNQRPIGYLTSFLAPLLMVISVWFWTDLNEELEDLPPLRGLPLTVKLWRWSLSAFGIVATSLTFFSLPCLKNSAGATCNAWLEVPKGLHQILEQLFEFLFGANWSEALAAFVGYIALIAYLIGILQWLLVRLPKQGRIAGDF